MYCKNVTKTTAQYYTTVNARVRAEMCFGRRKFCHVLRLLAQINYAGTVRTIVTSFFCMKQILGLKLSFA